MRQGLSSITESDLTRTLRLCGQTGILPPTLSGATNAAMAGASQAHSMTPRARPKVPPVYFVVRLKRGGPWDWSRDMREQVGWGEHADFMDSLVDDGFIVLGGPLAGDREILHVVSAPSEQTARERLAQDNWHQSGMLTITSIEAWTVLLDGRREA